MVLSAAQARQAGVSIATARRLVRESLWTVPRRGVLCVLPAAEAHDPFPHGNRPEMRATAAALVRPDSAVSHESAALMFALPAVRRQERPILTAMLGNGEGRPDALIHRARLDAAEVTTWFGVPVTRPARTVIDIARDSGLRAGLVVADAALADGLVSMAELDAALVGQVRWPGVRTARRVVELASPLAESPLETLARLLVFNAGLPLPELQAVVHTRGGSYRVDGLWRDKRVILEADGFLKYATPADLRAEKLRQENLERAGYVVVRVTWDDVVHRPAETARRIASALRFARRAR
jgi:very-short-patch-repair endonuclease